MFIYRYVNLNCSVKRSPDMGLFDYTMAIAITQRDKLELAAKLIHNW
ncbi:hypothetical protein [Nostoc commune]|nr:hypothetical protein [Nostoc commune]